MKAKPCILFGVIFFLHLYKDIMWYIICWQQNTIIKLEYWFIAKDYAKVMLMVYLNPQKMEIKN